MMSLKIIPYSVPVWSTCDTTSQMAHINIFFTLSHSRYPPGRCSMQASDTCAYGKLWLQRHLLLWQSRDVSVCGTSSSTLLVWNLSCKSQLHIFHATAQIYCWYAATDYAFYFMYSMIYNTFWSFCVFFLFVSGLLTFLLPSHPPPPLSIFSPLPPPTLPPTSFRVMVMARTLMTLPCH